MRARLAGSATSPRDDAGMTLVEVMVAMLILTVVFSALASVLTTALHSLHGNENRVKANALANELLEELQDLDWDEVAFSDSDHGYRTAVDVASGDPCTDVSQEDCEATVTFEDEGESPPDDPRPRPLRDGGGGTMPVERDGTEYEVRTDITWIDDPATAPDTDYKRFRVTLGWSDLGRERSLTHTATRAPMPSEQEPAAFSIRTIDVYPELGFIKSPGESNTGKLDNAVEFADNGTMSTTSQGAVELAVVTTAWVDHVTVSFVNRHGDPVSASLAEEDLDGDGDLDGTEWTLSTATSSSWQYRNGDTTFVITATRDATPESEARVTKPVRYVYEDNDIEQMEIDGETATVEASSDPNVTSQVCVDEGGIVARDHEVLLTTWGMTVDDRVEVAGPGFGSEAEAAAQGSTVDGAIFRLVIEQAHNFSAAGDVATVEFTAVREFDGSAQTRTLGLELLTPDEWEGTKCDT